MGQPTAPAMGPALAVLELALQATTAYERPDLGRQVARVHARVTDPTVRVLVVGEFKQGKSSLVNALVTAPVCPVDDDVATAVPTAVRYADAPEAVALWAGDASEGEPRREAVDVDQTAAFVSEAGNPGNERNLAGFEIGLPRQLLRTGLVLVDTPGVGGLGSTHSAATIAALPSADAVLLVTDASQELTEPELEFLQMARDLCPTLACVVTKTDFHAEWRKIAELDRMHLASRDLAAPVLPTSATLRTTAATHTDRELNDESGYPALVSFLVDTVVGDAAGVAARAVAQVVTGVADQLEARFEVERAALTDPATSADLVAELEATQQRTAELRGRAARWQQTLSDGISDLVADADHDLRARLRTVSTRIDDAIADIDPGEVWDELEQWLYRMVNGEVAASYALVTARAQELTGRVAEHFAHDEAGPVGEVGVDVPIDRLRDVAPARAVDARTTSLATHGLTALRGSYGGVMMTGIIGSMLGFGLFNPVSLSFGVVLGRKAIRDERERALGQRRQQARQACRSYIDDVGFSVGKDARDSLRRMQRMLRDAFTEQAETLQRSTAEALSAVKSAVQADRDERARRLRDVDAELGRIRELRAAGERLVGAGGRGA